MKLSSDLPCWGQSLRCPVPPLAPLALLPECISLAPTSHELLTVTEIGSLSQSLRYPSFAFFPHWGPLAGQAGVIVFPVCIL